MPRSPDIEIKMRAAYESYEDGTNTILREAVSGTCLTSPCRA